jgi:hypothetical protein
MIGSDWSQEDARLSEGHYPVLLSEVPANVPIAAVQRLGLARGVRNDENLHHV